MELTTLVLSLVGALTGLINMVVILAVNGKLDRLTGRVDSLEQGHNAHVNSAAMRALARPRDLTVALAVSLAKLLRRRLLARPDGRVGSFADARLSTAATGTRRHRAHRRATSVRS